MHLLPPGNVLSFGSPLIDDPVTIRNAARFTEYRLFHQFRNNVPNQNVTFLNPRSFVTGNADELISRFSKFPTRASC